MSELSEPAGQIEAVSRLNKDLREAAKTLSSAEARYLVDAYYQMQEDRIRADHQARQAAKGVQIEGTDQPTEEPHAVIQWLAGNTGVLERSIRSALAIYTQQHVVGRWAQEICGIGPVITAGLLAHIDITRAPTVGHIWSFAGLNPEQEWKKGEKRPWNASLKRLCWLIGESFVKVQANEKDVYGKIYAARKVLEQSRNAEGRFADQAAASLAGKKWRGDTSTKAAYESGLLPPARIHLRATRVARKLFLAHYHEAAYFAHYGTLPPKPYIFEHGDAEHVHLIQAPNMSMIPGWAEARAAAK